MQAIVDLAAAEEQANQNAWVNRWGLDRYSVAGQLVNASAGFVSRATELGINMITSPAAIDVALTGAAIPDPVKQAYARLLQDKASPEDMELLNQLVPRQSTPDKAWDILPRTWANEIARIQKTQQNIEWIKNKTDLSSIVDWRTATRLQETLANDAQRASALYDRGDYLSAAGTLIGASSKPEASTRMLCSSS